MREKLKEWLLRLLVADLIRRRYGRHLMTVIVEENLDCFYEDNLFSIHSFLAAQLDEAVEYIHAKGDPLL